MDKIYRLKNLSLSDLLIILLGASCFFYAFYIAVYYAAQAPVGVHSFRQAQTAITAYWFVKNGFSLAYETPFAGPPWSIPFEFPVYQYVVALISKLTGYSITVTGRLVSFLFLTLCLFPVRAITKKLNLSDSVFYVFAVLLFSSPQYIYWGRSLMIETAAIFFCLVAIKYFVGIISGNHALKDSILFVTFITLGLLQKVTTGAPVLAVLSFVYLFVNIKESNSFKAFFSAKRIISALIYFGTPLAIGFIWTQYTDQVKSLNSFGVQLTSSALTLWNWGTLDQRLSSVLYTEVIWRRSFGENLSGALGLAILVIALFSNVKYSIKLIIITSLVLWLLPMFLFPGLHRIHIYYQSANIIFLIYAASVSIGHILNQYFFNRVTLVLLISIMVISNYTAFYKRHKQNVHIKLNKGNSREYAVSEILKKEVPQGKYFVAFGHEYNSSLAYLAERKSFTVPKWYRQLSKIALNPEHFIEEPDLGSVVVCPSAAQPTINDLIDWSTTDRSWKIGDVRGCYIAVPEKFPLNKTDTKSSVICQGGFQFMHKKHIDHSNVLQVEGWTTISGKNGTVPEIVYVTLTKENSGPLFFEALLINRADVAAHFKRPNDFDAGFSRIIDTRNLDGEFDVSAARVFKGALEFCNFKRKIFIRDGVIQ